MGCVSVELGQALLWQQSDTVMMDIDFSLYVKRLSQSPPTLVGALATALLVILQFVRMEAERGVFCSRLFSCSPKIGID